jgi:hypothetical protein
LAFCTMVAWLRKAIRMREAASLQGSPSTCTGIALAVVSSTSRHCVSRSPCPPTCSAACGHRKLRSGAVRKENLLLPESKGKSDPRQSTEWRVGERQGEETEAIKVSPQSGEETLSQRREVRWPAEGSVSDLFELQVMLPGTVSKGCRQSRAWSTHQRCHGETNDLEVAIIVPLGFEVVVLPRVAPGHGACTVPERRATGWASACVCGTG